MRSVQGSPFASTGTRTTMGTPMFSPKPSPSPPPRNGVYLGNWEYGMKIKSNNQVQIFSARSDYMDENDGPVMQYSNDTIDPTRFFVPNFNTYFRVQGDSLIVLDGRGNTHTINYTPLPSPPPPPREGFYRGNWEYDIEIFPSNKISMYYSETGRTYRQYDYTYNFGKRSFYVQAWNTYFTVEGDSLILRYNGGTTYTLKYMGPSPFPPSPSPTLRASPRPTPSPSPSRSLRFSPSPFLPSTPFR